MKYTYKRRLRLEDQEVSKIIYRHTNVDAAFIRAICRDIEGAIQGKGWWRIESSDGCVFCTIVGSESTARMICGVLNGEVGILNGEVME